MSKPIQIALVGNPNSGKSSLFVALTGIRQRIGNFPGVTVDRKAGTFRLGKSGHAVLIDLPGIYSLYPKSEDESIATQILVDPNHSDHPDLVVLVADSTNLRRSLLLLTQIQDLGLPVVLALNMVDLLEKEGLRIDREALSRAFGVPTVSISALKSTGVKELKKLLEKPTAPAGSTTLSAFAIPESFDGMMQPWLEKYGPENRYLAWWHMIQGSEEISAPEEADQLLSNELAVRYDHVQQVLDKTVFRKSNLKANLTHRLDKLLLHPVGGYLIFLGLLTLVFQAIFAWSSFPMDLIEGSFGAIGEWMASVLPDSWFSKLLVDGVWAGLGGIVIFIPQIALLFFFISILEDSGYMSRVVFLMDRIMRPFGFSGKSVIPLVGGMACAVPSIMMARTIPNKIERYITIMVTPLMSCSARIPVYVLLIGLFVPSERLWGIFSLQGLVMTGMYLLGFLMALAVAWVIKLVSRYQSNAIFVTELPQYRVPRWKNTALEMYHRSKTFVTEAGKVILVVSILLWFLASYGPGEEMAKVQSTFDAEIAQTESAEKITELETQKSSHLLRASYAGHVGQAIEPVIKPLGFDWKIGISLLTSFAAREVFVGTMATIYSAGDEASEDEEGEYRGVRDKMMAEINPDTGEPVYTTAVAISLLIFYAFAMQCMSTLAVVKKETGSWKTTFVMLIYMTGLAYFGSLIAYQVLA